MNMTIGDVADKWTILRMKVRISEESRKEFDECNAEFVQHTIPPDALADLVEANSKIWVLESDIRNGAKLPLAEVGKRALLIRGFNKLRIDAKNRINELFNNYTEVKVDHASGT